jgi:hypothetical protein
MVFKGEKQSDLTQHLQSQIFVESERGEERHLEFRALAASKLNTFSCHVAGGGSEYVDIGGVKIRWADHENTSAFHMGPDFNLTTGAELTPAELAEIAAGIQYPRLCKKTAFAMHLGLTVPKLKKLLPSFCYENVCEGPLNYPNTFVQYVIARAAFAELDKLGIVARVPVMQERWTEEDYSGR